MHVETVHLVNMALATSGLCLFSNLVAFRGLRNTSMEWIDGFNKMKINGITFLTDIRAAQLQQQP